ncbi:MAG: terminase [Anaerolineae bacterium]
MTMTALPDLTATRSPADHQLEWETCAASALYFAHHYIYIYDKVLEDWIPFTLWRAQAQTLQAFQRYKRVVVLKARQIGLTWLALAYALWKMLFHPIQTVLLFSRRDDEAVELLDFRLKGMYARLPRWMQARTVEANNAHYWELSNGSRARAFPTNAGDSYAGTIAIADEFDLVPDQGKLMRAVEPAVGDGGQMILLSRADKTQPNSRFKAIYKAAKQDLNEWHAVFLPWYVHPERTAQWYAEKKAATIEETGSADDMFEQYPATDDEALAARTLNKRFAPGWLAQCYHSERPLITLGVTPFTVREDGAALLVAGQAYVTASVDVPAIPGLKIWRLPQRELAYVMGADPAEGLPSSDDSSLTVVEDATGEEVARLDGKYEPKAVFPGHIIALGRFYNRAPVMVERNNHGHAVIGHLQNAGYRVLGDPHDRRAGWNNSPAGKVRLYDDGAATFMSGDAIVHDDGTFYQLQSIEKDTLRAPEGEHDDKADSFVLAQAARHIARPHDWGATA